MVIFNKYPQGLVYFDTVAREEYQYLLPKWQLPLYHLTTRVQDFLLRHGISWHNWFADECCRDFSCCINGCSDDEKAILKSIAEFALPVIPINYEQEAGDESI